MGNLTRREFLIRSGGLVAVAAGCGDGEKTSASVQQTTAAAPLHCDDGVIAHKYGRTTITRTPGRIVPLTVRDQDTLLALNVIPVAVRDGFYREPYVAWPWVRDALDDHEPTALAEGELNFEQVAVLGPDLIIGAGSGITQREYEILSRIAPTVAQSGRYVDYGVPWQEITRTVSHAVCRAELGAERIADAEAGLTAAREEHRGLAGATGVVAVPSGPDGTYWVYGPEDSRSRFLASVGMRTPSRITALAGDRFAVRISAERLDLLDADVLVWLATPAQRAALARNPIYARLTAARDGREVFLEWDSLFTAAMTNTSVLNLPFLLEHLVPRLVGALGGNRSGTNADA